MSLDDRLKGAYQRQLEEVQRDLDVRPIPLEGRRSAGAVGVRLVGLAAALLVVAGGALAITRAADRAGRDSVQTEAGDGSAFDESTATSLTTTLDGSAPTPSSTADTDQSPPTDAAAGSTTVITGSTTSSPPASSATAPSSTAPSTTAPSTTALSSNAPPPTSTGATRSGGVASTVCPSGARARLEMAASRYVGENRGWGRKDDLVDEQEGPYYFMAWEPNYELPVTVEIVLVEPVSATDIRVFQDPFTPVTGTIIIEAAEQQIDIELSGTDGWRVHQFARPTVIDRFTISRNAVESNIMEVLLCVDPSP